MEDKKSIRPVLNLSSNNENESFQNETLRPILKLQHDIIVRVFSRISIKQKVDIHNFSNDRFTDYIKKVVFKNIGLRNQLLGVVIGQFTNEEYISYEKNTSEFHKRIIQMIQKRLLDSIEEIKDINIAQKSNLK
ncbi:glyoxalase [Tenacibaculum sp. 190524A02b]|uniref:Glyoxalase n=1 Tax=Tenacibaculum vairaonense TaxID=3137860 RepID=A0ABM9PNB6_9FLAO